MRHATVIEAAPEDVRFVEQTYGPVAATEFEASTAGSRAALLQFARELLEMDDREFVAAAAQAILDSAQANRFAGRLNLEDVHARATMCYAESRRRHVAAGHTPDCRGMTLYSSAFNQAVRRAGHSSLAETRRECACPER